MQEQHSASLASPEEDDILAFIIAIKSGSIDKMKELLAKYRGNISNRLESQLRQPPLYFSVINADEEMGYEMTKALIDAGANANFKDANEQTIMFYCCRDGKRKLVEYLVTLGCRLDEEDLYGQTPIYYVASENRLNLLELFSPEMMNHVDKLAKQTPLFYAARKGHLDMCRALVDKGCDVNHVDSSGKTAVEYAKKMKYQEVADYLAAEAKKHKELARNQSQNHIQESSQNEAGKKKKKETPALNMNKNNYKISVLRENGEVHDLTEEEVRELYKSTPELETYLTNPDSIPQELLESTLAETWEKIALKIVNLCWKLKGAYWFYEPVDPIKFGISNYFDIISKPMDLGTVKKKLNYNAYAKPEEYVEDVRQVFRNCYAYNGEQHEISASARQVESLFEESIKSQGLTKFMNS